jgi:iron complex transport system substrate-binding protein
LYLVENKEVATPNDGLKIVVPVEKIAVASTTYYGFLELLGEINSIKGACFVNNVPYNQTINQKFESNQIVNLGDAFSPDIEQIMMLQPQIFMLSSYNQQDESVKRLVNAGVSVVYNNEWTENSLLARAEWLKFIAAFYNKEKQADTIFSKMEKNYFEAKQLTENVNVKPTILAGSNFKGTWYMAGGKSYMGQLFTDAGSDYFFKNDTTTTSLALSYEMVLKNFHSCDVWLNAPVNTMQKLFAMDERNRLFKAAQNGSVFAFTAKTKENGANDFWESGIANPDIVLKDVIWALHPALLPDYQPVYIEKLH